MLCPRCFSETSKLCSLLRKITWKTCFPSLPDNIALSEVLSMCFIFNSVTSPIDFPQKTDLKPWDTWFQRREEDNSRLMAKVEMLLLTCNSVADFPFPFLCRPICSNVSWAALNLLKPARERRWKLTHNQLKRWVKTASDLHHENSWFIVMRWMTVLPFGSLMRWEEFNPSNVQ